MRNNFLGRIEIICGPMFSGKTEELIRRINRLRYSKKEFLLFKPKLDNRYFKTKVTSHNKNKESAILVDTIDDIKIACEQFKDIRIIAIDEVQFIKSNRPLYLDFLNLKSKGYEIILSGLDMDYRGVPFQLMPEIMAIADDVKKLKAVCFECGNDAGMSHKKSKEADLVDVGSNEKYSALCFSCWKSKNS